MEFPLQGIKVLDFSRVLAGPYASRMLSDLGADVVKIEPPEGDQTRKFGRPHGDASGFYVQQNVGKRNICVDMKAEGAQALIYKMVEIADVVIENFRPGVMDRFGVGWKELSKINPKLIMLSISGYGQTGPDAKRAAYAPALHAETGLIARQADAVAGPANDLALSFADTTTGMHGLVGLLSALLLRQRTGKGQHIDMAMFNAVHSMDDFAHLSLDNAWTNWEGSTVWEAPEGRRILISGEKKWLWHCFSRRGGVQDPTPKGADLATKIECRRQAIAENIKSFATWDDMIAFLDKVNLAWGEVRDFGDAHHAPAIKTREVVVEVDDGHGNRVKTVQSPYRFSDASSGISAKSQAPRKGQHNVEALQDWLGLSEQEIGGLVETGILLDPQTAEDVEAKAKAS